MKKPYSMKLKDFGNRLKTLNCFLTLLPHDDEKDAALPNTDLKSLLLKSMPLSWQNVYLLKGKCISDSFQQIPSYFVEFQSITDYQLSTKAFSASQSLDYGNQHKYICTNCGQSSCFSSSFQNGWTNIDHIPQKNNSNNPGPFVDFKGPCLVHPMSSHTWGDCFNNPKNKTAEGQNINPHNIESQNRHGYYYLTRD